MRGGGRLAPRASRRAGVVAWASAVALGALLARGPAAVADAAASPEAVVRALHRTAASGEVPDALRARLAPLGTDAWELGPVVDVEGVAGRATLDVRGAPGCVRVTLQRVVDGWLLVTVDPLEAARFVPRPSALVDARPEGGPRPGAEATAADPAGAAARRVVSEALARREGAGGGEDAPATLWRRYGLDAPSASLVGEWPALAAAARAAEGGAQVGEARVSGVAPHRRAFVAVEAAGTRYAVLLVEEEAWLVVRADREAAVAGALALAADASARLDAALAATWKAVDASDAKAFAAACAAPPAAKGETPVERTGDDVASLLASLHVAYGGRERTIGAPLASPEDGPGAVRVQVLFEDGPDLIELVYVEAAGGYRLLAVADGVADAFVRRPAAR